MKITMVFENSETLCENVPDVFTYAASDPEAGFSNVKTIASKGFGVSGTRVRASRGVGEHVAYVMFSRMMSAYSIIEGKRTCTKWVEVFVHRRLQNPRARKIQGWRVNECSRVALVRCASEFTKQFCEVCGSPGASPVAW